MTFASSFALQMLLIKRSHACICTRVCTAFGIKKNIYIYILILPYIRCGRKKRKKEADRTGLSMMNSAKVLGSTTIDTAVTWRVTASHITIGGDLLFPLSEHVRLSFAKFNKSVFPCGEINYPVHNSNCKIYRRIYTRWL